MKQYTLLAVRNRAVDRLSLKVTMYRWLVKKKWTIAGYLLLCVTVFYISGRIQQEPAEKISRVRKFGRKQLQVVQDDQSFQHIFPINIQTANSPKILTEVKKTDPRRNDVKSPQESPKEVQRPPLLVYVYELPEKFTTGLIPCSRNRSISVANRTLETKDILLDDKVRRSNLEVLLHWKFSKSKYRTMNPAEADVFFIPFYPSFACSCQKTANMNTTELHVQLWNYMNNEASSYFQDGFPTRPHFMALGTSERQHWTKNCPLLRDYTHTRGITFIGVEKENNINIRNYSGREYAPMIVAPYPTYQKSEITEKTRLEDFVNQIERKNLAFFADDDVNAHKVRTILKSEMRPTSLSYEEYVKAKGVPEKLSVSMSETELDFNKTFEWMKHSIFCLVPPSNTQIQRHFYDAILAGCIPVTFYPRKRNTNSVEYPFERTIDYYKTTVNIPIEEVFSGDKNTTWFLGTIPKLKIKLIQRRLFDIAPKLRYSSNIDSKDAFEMIIQEVMRLS